MKSIHERIHARVIRHRIRRYQSIEGWLSEMEALTLYRLAARVSGKNAVVVEIGSWKGKSTYCLARGLTEGRLIAIDPFDASGEAASADLYQRQKGTALLVDQFKENMRQLNVLHKIEILHGYSSRFAGGIQKIDLLFIDGDHSVQGCNDDFRNYAPHLVSAGYLAIHDYDPHRKEFGPTDVVERAVIPSKLFETVGIYGSLFVSRKR